MKRKRKFNCDDLVRSIVERNLRGFISKSHEGEDAPHHGEGDVSVAKHRGRRDAEPNRVTGIQPSKRSDK